MMISHSIFPPANLVSEALGAIVCMLLYTMLENKIAVAPAITTFVATLVSGFSFILVCMLVMLASIISIPTGTVMGFFVAVAPIVIITAVFNCIVTQVLYFPAKRILSR